MENVVTTIVTPIIRHGLTVAAGALVTTGLLDSAQSGNFVTIVTGLIVGAIGLGWSFAKNSKKS